VGERRIVVIKKQNYELKNKAESLNISLMELKKDLKTEKDLVESLKKNQAEIGVEKNSFSKRLNCLKSHINTINADNLKNERMLKNVLLECEANGEMFQAQENNNNKLTTDCKLIKNKKQESIDELLSTRQQLAKMKKIGVLRRIFKRY